MAKINNLLAVGDCITLGVGECLGNSYPERAGKRLGCPVTNRGYTLSTSREGIHLLHDNLQTGHDSVILQFGVADSHLSFRYAPLSFTTLIISCARWSETLSKNTKRPPGTLA